MVARNKFTQVFVEWFGAIKQDAAKFAEFRRSMAEAIAQAGESPTPAEYGKVMLAGFAAAARDDILKLTPILQVVLALALAEEVDWPHVAATFVADENYN